MDEHKHKMYCAICGGWYEDFIFDDHHLVCSETAHYKYLADQANQLENTGQYPETSKQGEQDSRKEQTEPLSEFERVLKEGPPSEFERALKENKEKALKKSQK